MFLKLFLKSFLFSILIVTIVSISFGFIFNTIEGFIMMSVIAIGTIMLFCTFLLINRIEEYKEK